MLKPNLRRANQVRIQSPKEAKVEQHTHKVIICSIMIPQFLDHVYTPPGEITKQKELLLDLCERTSEIIKGTPGIKYKFTKTTYLSDLDSIFENKIETYFKQYMNNEMISKAFIMISVYLMSLETRQKNVNDKVFNEDGSLKYELLKYLDTCVDENLTYESVSEFNKILDTALMFNFKSMYA